MNENTPPYNRRDFLTNIAPMLAGAGIVSLLTPEAEAAASSLADAASVSANNTFLGFQEFENEAVFYKDAFFGGGRPWYDAQAHGAVGDGIADDSDALQALINLFPQTVGAQALPIFLPAGTYRITKTLTMYRRAISFKGVGVGNPGNYPSAPGKGTTLVWDGNPNQPMIQVEDCRCCTFEDIMFLGNNAKPPSEGVFFFEPQSISGNGMNAHHLIRRCHFGSWTWTKGVLNDGQMNHGIRFGGHNTHNDKFMIENCTFSHCLSAGVSVDNTQSIWGHLIKPTFNRCGVGLKTASSVVVWNLCCNGSTICDLVLLSSANVHVHGYNSENAKMMFDVQNAYGNLTIDGGHIQFQAPAMTNGSYWGKHSGVSPGGLVIRNLRIYNGIPASGSPPPKLYIRRSTHAFPGFVVIEDCPVMPVYRLDNLSNYDIQSNASGQIVISIRTGDLLLRTKLPASTGATFGSTPPPFQIDRGITLQGTTGDGFVELREQTTVPSAPAANTIRLFVRDNGSGKSQLCALAPTGSPIVLATQA